jgi:2-polyprenyl-3-methyl-5-hydroxy-6-metoxy-1,4-benzoquinol methylase
MNKDLFINRECCPACKSGQICSLIKHGYDENIVKEYLHIEYPTVKNFNFPKEIFFEFMRCNGCGLSFQKHVFKEEYLGIVYNDWIDQNIAYQDHVMNGSWKIDYNRRIFEFAIRYLKKTTAKLSFLDYGAGFGASLDVANKMGFKTSAIEYSIARQERLKNMGISPIGENHQEKFDFIICDQVLEHATYPNRLLENINRLLDAKGLLYLAVPNCFNFEKKIIQTENILDPIKYHIALSRASVGAFQHINFFDHSSLIKLLKSRGFQPIFPFQMCLVPPLTLKSVMKPLFHRLASTVFFCKKIVDY